MPKEAYELETETQVKEPPAYQVLLLNDDFTPMDFVTLVLQTVFRKNHEESVKLMLQVHHQGKAVCGIYPFDIARSKALQVRTLAKKEGHPLQATVEEA